METYWLFETRCKLCCVFSRSWLTSKWPNVRGWWTVRVTLIPLQKKTLDLLQYVRWKKLCCWRSANHKLLLIVCQMCWRRWILLLQMIGWCSGRVRGKRTESSSRWWKHPDSVKIFLSLFCCSLKSEQWVFSSLFFFCFRAPPTPSEHWPWLSSCEFKAPDSSSLVSLTIAFFQ